MTKNEPFMSIVNDRLDHDEASKHFLKPKLHKQKKVVCHWRSTLQLSGILPADKCGCLLPARGWNTSSFKQNLTRGGLSMRFNLISGQCSVTCCQDDTIEDLQYETLNNTYVLLFTVTHIFKQIDTFFSQKIDRSKDLHSRISWCQNI